MKIKGRITILCSKDGARIEINDENANVQFLQIQLSAEQFMACISRLSMVPCELEIQGMEKVGKQHENKKFEFELPDWYIKLPYRNREENHRQLAQVAQNQLTDGWVADDYFGSQDSFFKKEDKEWARVTIRRWL